MAILFGYKKSNGVMRPVRFDDAVPMAVHLSYKQCRELTPYEINMDLSSLEERYKYKPENDPLPKKRL